MKRAACLTGAAFLVASVVAGLVRDARGLEPATSRSLLLALFVYLGFEWITHFLGSRVWRTPNARPDRAAWAALSSVGIWIALLAAVPFGMRCLGIAPSGLFGILVLTMAAAAALAARLWFLREIFQLKLERAAVLWVTTRATAAALVCAMLALYALSSAVGGGPVPMLRIGS
ncbi:MAG: hypothetical protein ACYTKD_18795 [Planctomycetota bacterium]